MIGCSWMLNLSAAILRAPIYGCMGNIITHILTLYPCPLPRIPKQSQSRTTPLTVREPAYTCTRAWPTTWLRVKRRREQCSSNWVARATGINWFNNPNRGHAPELDKRPKYTRAIYFIWWWHVAAKFWYVSHINSSEWRHGSKTKYFCTLNPTFTITLTLTLTLTNPNVTLSLT